MARTSKSRSRSAVSWADSAGAGDRDGAFLGLSGNVGAAVGLAGAILLMVLCPAVVIYTYVINNEFDGSLQRFVSELILNEGLTGLAQRWPPLWSPKTLEAWKWFLTFGSIQAFMQLYVPGDVFHGPVSPQGNIPVYKANGVASFFLTGILFFTGTWLGIFDPARLYDIFPEVLGVCNIFALALCVFLTWKGLNMPSSSDSGSNGMLVYDFYWGTELYPRIGKHFDIKTWTNCRMGMMSWTFINICFAFKQLSLYGSISNSMLVSIILSGVYCFKFFLWETGYWRTMDIAHDRAGYYLCWGCLNWVTCIYTSQALYLTRHPIALPPAAATAILLAGLAMIYINWEADDQRMRFRETNGDALVWGRKPSYIIAKYSAGNGQVKTSLLLTSGWWGLARHMHYVPEIMASLFWTLPALFNHLLPWFYVVYLTILLLDRLFRDQARCKAKYGKYWDQYCEKVPYMIIPYVL